MSFWKTICLASVLCISRAASAAETPIANKWDAKSQQVGITARQREAYRQLARLHDFRGQQMTEADSVWYRVVVSTPNPMTLLGDMDIEVVPILVEALDDNTPTKTVNDLDRRHWVEPGVPHRLHVWKVNELLALLIQDIADQDFFVGRVSLLKLNRIEIKYRRFRKRFSNGMSGTNIRRPRSERSKTWKATVAIESGRRIGSERTRALRPFHSC